MVGGWKLLGTAVSSFFNPSSWLYIFSSGINRPLMTSVGLSSAITLGSSCQPYGHHRGIRPVCLRCAVQSIISWPPNFNWPVSHLNELSACIQAGYFLGMSFFLQIFDYHFFRPNMASLALLIRKFRFAFRVAPIRSTGCFCHGSVNNFQTTLPIGRWLDHQVLCGFFMLKHGTLW